MMPKVTLMVEVRPKDAKQVLDDLGAAADRTAEKIRQLNYVIEENESTLRELSKLSVEDEDGLRVIDPELAEKLRE